MHKILSIKLFNGEIYQVGNTSNIHWVKIEKFVDDSGLLWFLVVDSSGEYIEVNGRFVMTVRYEK